MICFCRIALDHARIGDVFLSFFRGAIDSTSRFLVSSLVTPLPPTAPLLPACYREPHENVQHATRISSLLPVENCRKTCNALPYQCSPACSWEMEKKETFSRTLPYPVTSYDTCLLSGKTHTAAALFPLLPVCGSNEIHVYVCEHRVYICMSIYSCLSVLIIWS